MVRSFEEISKILKEALSMNAARANALTLIIFAMISCETVNLSKLSKHLKTDVKQESSYKRLQRFMKEVTFKPMELARALLAFAGVEANSGVRTLAAYTAWVARLATKEYADELVVMACALEFQVKIVCFPYTPIGSPPWAVSTYKPSTQEVPWSRTINMGNNDVHYMLISKP